MSWWRPAHEARQTRRFWWDSDKLKRIDITGLAAKLVWRHMNTFTVTLAAANDRDGKRW